MVKDGEGKPILAQTRKIYPEDPYPKYLTYGDKSAMIVFGAEKMANVLVLVEDMVSAWHVGKILPCMALLGTELSTSQYNYLMHSDFKNFVIFLDDDNMQVKKNSLKMQKRLSKIGNVTVIHSEGKDPKDYTQDELARILL